MYPSDAILSYQEVIFRVPISKRSLIECIKIFFNHFVCSSSGDRSGFVPSGVETGELCGFKNI